MRCDDEFDKIWEDTMLSAHQWGLDLPRSPKQKKLPRRFKHSDSPVVPQNINCRTNLRRAFFEVLDKVVIELRRRFCQPKMVALVQLEMILSNALSGKQSTIHEI